MKRTLINLLSLIVIVGGSSQLSATEFESSVDESEEVAGESNYQTCMGQCERSGYLFFTCHNTCKGLATAN